MSILFFKYYKLLLFLCDHSEDVSDIGNLFLLFNCLEREVLFFRHERINKDSKTSVDSSKRLNDCCDYYSNFDE
jgi:hypothetical protein